MTDALPHRFINYLRQWDAPKQKWQKIPCDPHGMRMDPHQPGCWMTYEEASKHATWDESRPDAPYGVGFVFHAEHDRQHAPDGLCWFLLDIDDGLDANGQWKADADLTFRSFSGVYGEVSTSGNGLHIIGKCDPEQVAGLRNKWRSSDGGGLDREFYHTGRFVALSKGGLTFRGEELQDNTRQILKLVPAREELGDLPDGRDPAYTGPDDDDELIRIMLRSRGGAAAAFGEGLTVGQLWEADAVAVGQKYPDPARSYDASAADMALMSHLAFWTGKDAQRMDRLFRKSGLCRDKYLKREKYRRETIHKAIRMCKKVYDRPQLSVVAADAPPLPTGASAATESLSADGYMPVAHQFDWFTGCVYVRDQHRVLTPTGELLRPEQFRATYGGKVFALDALSQKTTKNAFECFTESQAYQFPKVRATMFRPDLEFGEIEDDMVNMFRRHQPIITQGDVTPFLDHMHKMLPDERDLRILLCYCAAIVQHPGVLFQWAPLIQGVEGNGKTLIARCLKYIIGQDYVHDPRADEMMEKQNDWMVNKVLQVVEEVWVKGRYEVMEFLKPLITNERFEYRGMGKAKVMVPRTFNWIFCSNHRDALIKTRSDRRVAPFFTAQQTEADLERDGMGGDYFPDLYDWLRHGGGYANVAHFLLTYEIDPEFDPAGRCHRAPVTSSTEAAITASKGGIEAEIAEAIDSGMVGFRGGWVSSWHLMNLVKQTGFRVTRPKLAEILTQMGYAQWGRSPIRIMNEQGNRPSLWYLPRDGAKPTHHEYLAAQGDGVPYT